MIENHTVHERKLTHITALRDSLLWAIGKMVWYHKRFCRCAFKKGNAAIRATIRPLTYGETKNRRIFKVILRIIEKIRTRAGSIRIVLHRFAIELPVLMGKMSLA